jgi:hypothetical protein
LEIEERKRRSIMYILLIALYSGEVLHTYHDTSQECERALYQAIDEGRRKKIADIKCFDAKTYYQD